MKSVAIIMVPVKDRQQAKAFYLQLGFEVLVEAQDPHGEPWIQMGIPGTQTSISLSGFNGIICEVDDIKTKVAELKKQGIEVGKVDETPWGTFAWLTDLDGNSLCLHEK